jgi:hypothetical protein
MDVYRTTTQIAPVKLRIIKKDFLKNILIQTFYLAKLIIFKQLCHTMSRKKSIKLCS